MTDSQRTERERYAEVFTRLRQSFADLGVHPHSLTYDYEARDQSGEPVVLLGWLTTRQAEMFTHQVAQLRKEAGR